MTTEDQVPELPSTRPYLLRALHEWCTDNDFTPYLVVRVNDSVRVPREYVNNGEIVLNVSYDATSALQLGNDFIEFKARFGGRPHEIIVPVRRVVAIYARENGQGMAFQLEDDAQLQPGPALAADAQRGGASPLHAVDGPAGQDKASDAADDEPRPPQPSGGGAPRPSLKRVK